MSLVSSATVQIIVWHLTCFLTIGIVHRILVGVEVAGRHHCVWFVVAQRCHRLFTEKVLGKADMFRSEVLPPFLHMVPSSPLNNE